MMRCVVALVFVGLSAPAALADSADGLQLDAALLGDVGELLTDQGAFVPLAQDAAPPPRKTGGGSGGSLPPQLSGVGIGLQVGSPTALTIKFAGVQQNGFVLGIGTGFNYYNRYTPSLSVHGDYLLHLATLVRDSQLAVTFYAGLGLWVAIGDTGYGGFFSGRGYGGLNNFGVGVRVPLGLSLSFGAAPVEIYLELDPALFVFPVVSFGVGASLGFRWHF